MTFDPAFVFYRDPREVSALETLADMAAEAEAEFASRERRYPGMVAKGLLTQAEATRELAIMGAIRRAGVDRTTKGSSMSDEPLKTIHGQPGDPMFEALFAMMDAMRAAIVPVMEEFADPRDALSVAMSAASTFAGTHAGTLMTIGALRSQDRKRVGEAALANFRQGIDFRRNRGMRIYTDQAGGSA